MFPPLTRIVHWSLLTLAGAIAIPEVILLVSPAAAEEKKAAVSVAISAADIEAAEYVSGDLPAGQSALTAKVQTLLDRSGISPGVVDGWRGGMSESALKAFQRRAGLPMDGRMSPVVWQLLQPYNSAPLTMEYTITEEDTFGLVDNIPSDYGDKAKMTSQGYVSVLEKLSERFHMDEKFLAKLNPGVAFVPGAKIRATVPAKPIRGKVARIIVDKSTRRVAVYDDKGRMLADYPATVGSDQTPSPHGTHTVDAVALNPTYTYNPSRNFKQGDNDRVLTIPPGPNGPVGNVWIDLSKPTYGIHGTATPSRLFVNQSNGCVRLTNWDANELAGMVQAGKTIVEFLDPGVSIADVTAPSAAAAPAAIVASAMTAMRPIPRPRLATTDMPAEAVVPTLPQAVPGAAPVVAGNDALSTAIADAVEAAPSVGAIAPAPALAPTAPRRRPWTVAPEVPVEAAQTVPAQPVATGVAATVAPAQPAAVSTSVLPPATGTTPQVTDAATIPVRGAVTPQVN